MGRTYDRDGTTAGTGIPAKYDLVVTDEDDVATGLVVDWKQGGYSWQIDRPSLPTNNSAATADSGESYDVRDANDYYRIIFTDWVKGAGQESRDETGADASLFWTSKNIDVSKRGYMKLGPAYTTYTTTPTLIDGPVYAALKTDGTVAGIADGVPAVFAAFAPAATDPRASIRYTADGVTWQAVTFAGTDPTGSVTCFADDGEYCYAAFSGNDGVWRGKATDDDDWENWGSGSTADDIVAMCYCDGIIYAAKGSESEDAQLGSFDMATGIWTKLSTHYVSHSAATVGLVAVQQNVYWTITNGIRTTVYKCSAHVDPVVFQEYAEFPTGFIGLCSEGYGGIVYVGGYYDGPDDTTTSGVGALYACTDSGPALVADIGVGTEDWRIYALTAYEKQLYFLCGGSVWRWDLVNGGYSHWFDVATTGTTEEITWDVVEEDMSTEPGLPDWTVTVEGSPIHTVADGILTLQKGVPTTGTSVTYEYAHEGLDAQAGMTMELAFPAYGIHGAYFYLFLDNDIQQWYVLVRSAHPSYTYGTGDDINIYFTNPSDNSFIKAGTWRNTDRAKLRLTLKAYGNDDAIGSIYLNDQLLRETANLFYAGASPRVGFAAQPTWFTNVSTAHYRYLIDSFRYTNSDALPPTGGVTGDSWMTAARDAVWVGTKDIEIRKQVMTLDENSGSIYAASGSLKSSRSTARMSTIPKYFSSAEVSLVKPLEGEETVAVQAVIDGEALAPSRQGSEEAGNLLKFDIDRSGKEIALITELACPAGDSAPAGVSTPIVTHAAVKFTPMTTSNVLHTFTCNLRDHVQSGISGHKWDQDPDTVINSIVGWGNKVLTVEYAGLMFKGKLEALEATGYPQSRHQTADNQGTVRLVFREMA